MIYKNNKENTEAFLEDTDLLQKITEEEFNDYNSWVDWWEINKVNLELNEEGTMLVVTN